MDFLDFVAFEESYNSSSGGGGGKGPGGVGGGSIPIQQIDNVLHTILYKTEYDNPDGEYFARTREDFYNSFELKS